jgi:hypothetical protein
MSAQTIFSDLSRPVSVPAQHPEHKSLLDQAATILWKACGVFERHSNEMRDHRERGPDPDYAPRTALHIGSYYERPPSWQKWILTIVAGLIPLGIAGVIWEQSLVNSRLSSIETRQIDSEGARQQDKEAMLQRMRAEEERTSRLEAKVFH